MMYTQLDALDRRKIEEGLRKGQSFSKIARIIHKSHSTIIREVLRNSVASDKIFRGATPGFCMNYGTCTKSMICSDPKCFRRRCRGCRKCSWVCPDFVERKCELLKKSPFVCNGCRKETMCGLKKRYYMYLVAQELHEKRSSESHKGIRITEKTKNIMTEILTNGLNNGQGVDHIMTTNPDKFDVCRATVYNYAKNGICSIEPDMFPEMSKRKPRKKIVSVRQTKESRIGRTFAEFEKYMEKNNMDKMNDVVEMDSVIGKKGQNGFKVLLTFYFNGTGLFLAFLRDANTAQSVIDHIDRLQKLLGRRVFRELFPVILTDNGCEFTNPHRIEFDGKDPHRRTTVFYCNPYSSYQKPHVENVHRLLRRILLKSDTFCDLTQEDINLAVSHINSYTRNKLDGVTPYDKFAAKHGTQILDKLGIKRIDAKHVMLSPKLLNR
ncbi:MAG: IS30 family transposase [Victivallaceae bacterium]|nr:IS30 family transposase [Victivallaceae bacterium]